MTSRKSLSKRKYPCVTNKGKWFTGYEGEYIIRANLGQSWVNPMWILCEESNIHETKVLRLKPSHTLRGRSAANIVCIDEDDYKYLMSMKSIDNFLQALVSGKIVIKDGFFEAEFCQVKQGQNYFIDLVEE
jgi:hypothetical protein